MSEPMKEDFSHSRSKYEQNTLLPAKRRRRWEYVGCALTVIALVLNYLNESTFHWW